jgi:hypothetical protein
MAQVPGIVQVISTPLLVSAWLPGRTDGLQQPEPEHFFSAVDAPASSTTVIQSAVNAGAPGGLPTPPKAKVLAQLEVSTGPGMDWFEKIHIFPDDSTDNPNRRENHKIDFGNILAQIDDVYEIYNAHRATLSMLTTIDNNVTPGIELPSVSAPMNVTAQTSILDPSSTFNTGGVTGLGTLVKTKVRALQDGLPTFDGTVDFFFSPGNLVQLLLTGSRITMTTAEFDAPVEETMAFLTDVIEVLDGGEQRLALRKQPREGWRVRYELSGTDRQRFQNILFDWQSNLFGLPLWHERLRLTAAVSVGATSFSTTGATDVDLRVGGLVGILKLDGLTFDVLEIATVSATTVTTTSGTANSYAVGDLLMPVRTTRIAKIPQGTRHPVNLEVFNVEYEAVDNDTGAPAASSTAWNPNTHNGRVLLDECNVIDGPMQEDYERRIVVVDNSTGNVTQSSPWNRNKRVSQKGFVAHGRAQIKNLKALLRHLRGRQKAFYLPTFIEDLTIAADIGIGTATIDVSHISYTRHAKARDPKRIFRITFTDGTSLTRNIVSSVVQSATVERLTLNTTWPANRTVAEVERIQFYELVRFDTDSFTIRYPIVGSAFVEAPVRVVFDDD